MSIPKERAEEIVKAVSNQRAQGYWDDPLLAALMRSAARAAIAAAVPEDCMVVKRERIEAWATMAHDGVYGERVRSLIGDIEDALKEQSDG